MTPEPDYKEEQWRVVPEHSKYEVSNLYRWRRKKQFSEYTEPRTSKKISLSKGSSTSLSILVKAAFENSGVVSEAVPVYRTKVAEHINLLGKIPDLEIAKLTGVSRQAVASFR